MKCEEAQELIIDSVSEKLESAVRVELPSSVESTRLDEHLQICAACHSLFLELQETAEIWGQGDILESNESVPSLNLVQPVMNRVEEYENVSKNKSKNAVKNNANNNAKNNTKVAVFLKQKHQIFHFGLAASIALFMFHFGIFEQSGRNILLTMTEVSHRMQELAQYVSNI